MIYTIHNTVMCGRPAQVFVNGNLVDSAFYADTVKGIVKYYPKPYSIKYPERDCLYSRTLKGDVEVKELDIH